MAEQLHDILRKAGRMMLDYQHPQVYDKGRHADFVTEADIAVQAYLLEALAGAYPTARFFAEEKRDNVLTDELTFIIDPIDGTTNYFRHRRCSMISVGAVENRRTVFGALYDPYLDELYTAERGKGAWCNGQRLHVTDAPLDSALVSFGTAPYYEELFSLTTRTLGSLLPRVTDVRRTGSACVDLCDVASGRSDAMVEWRLQPWDYCAGSLLIDEAGGRCGSILGGEVTHGQPMPFMAGNPRVFEPLQQLLQQLHREEEAARA